MSNRALLVLGCVAMVVSLAVTPVQAAFVGEDINTSGGSSTGTPPGPITVIGDGGDIWGTSDAFHYYHDTWTGDFNAVVRLVSQQNTNGWAKAGIMARESTDPGSRHAHISATPGNGITLQWRDSNGGNSAWPNTKIPGSPNSDTAPFWLSLSRRGNTYTASWAPDNAGTPGAWSESQSHTNGSMPATTELGLNVTSHSSGNLSTCVFNNLQIGNWQAIAEIAVDQDFRVVGKAFGQDRDTLAVLGPAHWKIERMVPKSYSGPGLENEWFPNQSHTPPTIVPPFHTDRIDWTSANYPPETGWSGNHDDFSVRYTGRFYADHDGDYSFEEHVDDQAWLVIDGSQVLTDNTWDNDTSVTIPLTEGWHEIEFRTREGGGGDYGRLRWDPNGGTSWQVMTVADALFETEYSWLEAELLAEGWGNVGDLATMGYFTTLTEPGFYDLRLTVDYLGEKAGDATTAHVPEPATLILLGSGVLGLVRWRRRRK